MPWNGSGAFARNYSWVTDDANGINITASRMDDDTDDITVNGLGNCLTRDGQGFATANLPMAGFRHINVGDGVALTDYASLGQVQNNSGFTDGGIATGAPGIFAITLTPPLLAYVRGQRFTFTTDKAAIGGDTLNISTLGAIAITKGHNVAIAANDFLANDTLFVVYDGTRMVLVNTPEAVGVFTTSIRIGTAGSFLGTLQLCGNTSGTVSITTQATAGTWSFVLPSTQGLAGQPLVSGAGGATSWATVTGSGSFVLAVSPALSGVPTSPTAAPSDNSTQIATTAWVRNFISAVNGLPFATVSPALTYNTPGY